MQNPFRHPTKCAYSGNKRCIECLPPKSFQRAAYSDFSSACTESDSAPGGEQEVFRESFQSNELSETPEIENLIPQKQVSGLEGWEFSQKKSLKAGARQCVKVGALSELRPQKWTTGVASSAAKSDLRVRRESEWRELLHAIRDGNLGLGGELALFGELLPDGHVVAQVLAAELLECLDSGVLQRGIAVLQG